eukprot:TRINITY_DN1007_c1_g2_i1.p1 TRINITY_DN1007_c1_g2~~TRINITY_DN1007_c1_g2_i1.p1  ORF type:complete len:215 (+),score=30.97 TRINITY_DN1007_c1_g2_i1:138-782(+)
MRAKFLPDTAERGNTRGGSQERHKRSKLGAHMGPACMTTTPASSDNSVEFKPHFSAAISGDVEYVQSYLAAGGDVNGVDKWQESMLHKSALNNQTTIVELLLSQGAKVNQRNECQQTPLHYACISGGLTSVRCLLEKGGDVHARDKFQQAPLHCACIYGHVEVSYRCQIVSPTLSTAVFEKHISRCGGRKNGPVSHSPVSPQLLRPRSIPFVCV